MATFTFEPGSGRYSATFGVRRDSPGSAVITNTAFVLPITAIHRLSLRKIKARHDQVY